MVESLTVVVVDDHSLFRSGVVRALSLDRGIKVVAEGSNAAEAFALADKHRPNVILLDISMPGDGIQAAADIALIPDGPRVVMLTVSERDEDVMRALDAGAVGYILKGIDAQDLMAAVRAVASGRSFISPNLTISLLASIRTKPAESPLKSLSPQEENTLRLVATGLSNRDVAMKLGILENTVKCYMTQLMRKLNVKNRVEATLIARKEWDS